MCSLRLHSLTSPAPSGHSSRVLPIVGESAGSLNNRKIQCVSRRCEDCHSVVIEDIEQDGDTNTGDDHSFRSEEVYLGVGQHIHEELIGDSTDKDEGDPNQTRLQDLQQQSERLHDRRASPPSSLLLVRASDSMTLRTTSSVTSVSSFKICSIGVV